MNPLLQDWQVVVVVELAVHDAHCDVHSVMTFTQFLMKPIRGLTLRMSEVSERLHKLRSSVLGLEFRADRDGLNLSELLIYPN